MKIDIHDQGFVRVVDMMGGDEDIVDAARVSYAEGTATVRSDESLIRYLMRHKHTSPFEMCEIKLHIKCPIFVARQWLRHRTANVNEISGRYSILPDQFYVPATDAIQQQSSTNRQGREDGLSTAEKESAQLIIEEASEAAYEDYEALLEMGTARELARVVLPVNTYTEFYWKIDLHNLLHFLHLRMDSHAQQEIRDYANAIADIVSEWVPLTWQAFEDYVLNAYTLSAGEIQQLRYHLTGEKVAEPIQLSKREQEQFDRFIEEVSQ